MKHLIRKLLLVLLLCSVSLGQYWKPPLGTLPDWGDPINDGLVGWWVMNEGIGSHVNDISLNGNHGTLLGNTAWVGGRVGPALSFDGTDDYVNISGTALDVSKDFTLSLCVNVDEITSTGQPLALIDPSFDQVGVQVTDTKKIRFFWFDVEVYTFIESPNAQSGWVHIVGRVVGTTKELFVNGVSEGTSTTNMNTFISDETFIGRGKNISGDPAEGYEGPIDHVKIYNRTLTLVEIQQLNTIPFKGLPYD